MGEQPTASPFVRSPAIASPFSRPAAPPKAFTRPVPRTASAPRTIAAPKSPRPIEIRENLPIGFMAGLVAAAVGAGLWAFVTLTTNYQITWMAVGVGFLVGWAIRVAGKGTHAVFGIVGAMLAVGGCAMGNLLAVIVIGARQFGVPLQDAFTRLTPDVVYSLMRSSFRPMHLFFYFVAIYEGYRFSIVGRTSAR